jgi:predicted DNA-binding transcriptional regulator AlpA
VKAGIAHNWPHLLRMIEGENFPPGIRLSRNVRAWRLAEVDKWLNERPVERKIIEVEKMMETRRANAEERARKAEERKVESAASSQP